MRVAHNWPPRVFPHQVSYRSGVPRPARAEMSHPAPQRTDSKCPPEKVRRSARAAGGQAVGDRARVRAVRSGPGGLARGELVRGPPRLGSVRFAIHPLSSPNLAREERRGVVLKTALQRFPREHVEICPDLSGTFCSPGKGRGRGRGRGRVLRCLYNIFFVMTH